MAQMVPQRPGGRSPDSTEVQIFQLLRDATPDTWIAMHHVGLQRHRTKPLAEIDFLVISEHGVFCVEVKGGLVRCEAGVWYAGRRVLDESPFQQVGSAGAALRSEVDELKPFVFGWGCMFPGGEFRERGPEILHETVYDSTTADVAAYFEALGEYWLDRYAGQRRPGPKDVESIGRAVRPDFEMRESLLATASTTEKELLELTRQQQEVVLGAREIEQLVVKGGAGTGKTWIAAIEAMRLADAGERTLFTCFNKALAQHLKQRLAHENLTVIHFDGLVSGLIRDGGTSGSLPDDSSQEDLFEVYRPVAAIEGAEKSGAAGSFDAVVLDEGQDLLTTQRIAVVDTLLTGGMKDGYWRVMWDPVQSLFLDGASANLGAISKYGVEYESFPIDVNCRNTRPIAARVEVLTDIQIDELAFADGPPAIDHEWDGAKVQTKRLRQVLNDWLDGGLKPADIVILSPRRFEKSVASSSIPGLSSTVSDVSGLAPDPQRATLGFSTVQSFKGLEAEAVALIDIDDISNDARRAALYVGSTRATTFFATLRAEATTPLFARRLADQAVRESRKPREPAPTIDVF